MHKTLIRAAAVVMLPKMQEGTRCHAVDGQNMELDRTSTIYHLCSTRLLEQVAQTPGKEYRQGTGD